MSDPTPIVIATGFALSLCLFMAGVLVRWGSQRNRAMAELPRGGGEESEEIPVPPELPVGKVPVWPYRGFDLLGAGIIAGVFGLLVISSFAVPASEVELSPDALMMNIGFQFAMAGVVTAAMTFRVSFSSWLGLRWKRWPWVFLIAPGAVMVIWLLSGLLYEIGYMDWMESLGAEKMQETVKLLQESTNPQALALMAFAAVVAAPLCEEIVFRGYLYPVAKRFSGQWVAALSSSLLFACAHGSLSALLPLFLFGIVLVYIYEKTGSLWAPVAVHFCFNSATVIAQFIMRHYDIPIQPAP
jgi:membrane protease YdiL (CAAX protease family)